MRKIVFRDLKAYSTPLILLGVLITLFSYASVRYGSIYAIISFVATFMPVTIAVIVFMGDRSLLPLMSSLPIKRETLVKGKYASCFVMTGIVLLYLLGIMLFLSLSHPVARDELFDFLSFRGIVYAILPTLVIVSLAYPVMFRFGISLGAKIFTIGIMLLYFLFNVIANDFIMKKLLVRNRGMFASISAQLKYLEGKTGPVILYGSLIALTCFLLYYSVRLSVKWTEVKDID